MIKIAIVILNYNSSGDCIKCVSYLKKQVEIEVEIIIVDNCSCSEDLVIVEKLCKEEDCTLLINTENRGYSAGNNLGLRYVAKSGYQYVLIANPDMEFPQTNYLATMVKRMAADRRIAIICSDIVGADGMHQNPMKLDGDWRNSWSWLWNIFKKSSIDTYDFIDNFKESHFCYKVSGCCFLCRISFLQMIGFLDEYPFLYCEEAILSRQVQRTGYKMFYDASLQAVHRHIRSVKGNPIARFKQWERSRIYFLKQYSDDSWIGKMLSVGSVKLYVRLMSFYFRIKNKKHIRRILW